MALNVALPPLTGALLDDILDGFALLSPISPTRTDSRENFKSVVSPFGSESSSGVSSFDADEIKKSSSLKDKDSNDNDNNEIDNEEVDEIINEDIEDIDEKLKNNQRRLFKELQMYHQLRMVQELQKKNELKNLYGAARNPDYDKCNQFDNDMIMKRNQKLMYNNRDILDLSSNLDNSSNFIQATRLENNIKHFFENRSQLHRLGANGNVQEYTIVSCDERCCDFMYPFNGYVNNNNLGKLDISIVINGRTMVPAPTQQHLHTQQQQQQQMNKISSPKNNSTNFNNINNNMINNSNINQNAMNVNRYFSSGQDFINNLFSQQYQQPKPQLSPQQQQQHQIQQQQQQSYMKNNFMNNFNNYPTNASVGVTNSNNNNNNNNNNIFNSNYTSYSNNNGSLQNSPNTNRWNDYAAFKQNKMLASGNNNTNNFNRNYNGNNTKNNYTNNYNNFGNNNINMTGNLYKHF